jgi:cytidine deaminase
MKDIDVLLQKAREAQLNAYAPYSHFFVGACLETVNGILFAACNVENVSYGLAVCAEANAIAAMVAAGERVIKQIVVITKSLEMASPCGACRQRLSEFSTHATVIHMCNSAGKHQSYSLGELLPHAFTQQSIEQ